MTLIEVESPLQRMVDATPTDYWNDSCAIAEVDYAVARGGTGATSNPVSPGVATTARSHSSSLWLSATKSDRADHDDPVWLRAVCFRARTTMPGARSRSRMMLNGRR